MLMEAPRCTMVTISQAAEGGGSSFTGSGAATANPVPPGTRPAAQEVHTVMKGYLACGQFSMEES